MTYTQIHEHMTLCYARIQRMIVLSADLKNHVFTTIKQFNNISQAHG